VPPNRELGLQFEILAEDYLRARGCRPVIRNFRSRGGEIDLIVTEKKTLVFVEVKYRTKSNYGHPNESVTPKKQNNIIKTAQLFLQKNPKYAMHDARFDVVSIILEKPDDEPIIEWLRGAFTT